MDCNKTKPKPDVVGEEHFMSADEESDSSRTSLMTVSSLASEKSRKRTRVRKEKGERHSSGSEGEAPATKVVVEPRRGRGRPPTTGEYVGLAQAKAALVAAERAEMELRAEQEVAQVAQKLRPARTTQTSRLSESSDAGEELTINLNKKALDCVATITTVATKSSNLKGTYKKALKDAATTIQEVVEAMNGRSSSEETRMLQAANARLQAEVADLRKQLADLRSALFQARDAPVPRASNAHNDGAPSAPVPRPLPGGGTPTDYGQLEQSLLRQLGGMMNARFEGIETRLLPEVRIRPPLAADLKAAAPAYSAAISRKATLTVPATKPPEQATASGSAPSASSSKGKGQGKKTKATSGSSQGSASLAKKRDLSPKPKETWVEVTKKRRRRGKKAASAAPQQQQPQSAARSQRARASKPKLRLPRSSAVVITVQPGAGERGVTYEKALTEARRKISLQELGIPSLNFRAAATGGRMLEIPGGTSGEKADLLAERIQALFKPEDIKVHRPQKCADLRISGLDDSVSKEEVAEAVAKLGGCSIADVRTGEIRRSDITGIGTTFVRCPVAAAKKVTGDSRLLIGWVSAQVKLLEQRPMRCFRCLEVGHVREQCKADADRSSQCYRCGQIGHKARECSGKPSCSVCAAIGKPSEHRLGSKDPCALPPKRKGRRGAAAAKSQLQPSLPVRDEREDMEA